MRRFKKQGSQIRQTVLRRIQPNKKSWKNFQKSLEKRKTVVPLRRVKKKAWKKEKKRFQELKKKLKKLSKKFGGMKNNRTFAAAKKSD